MNQGAPSSRRRRPLSCVFFLRVEFFSLIENLFLSGHCIKYISFLSIIRRLSSFLSIEQTEKPGSGLQNFVPSMGSTLRAREAAELTT